MEIDRLKDLQRREQDEAAKREKRVEDRRVISEQIALKYGLLLIMMIFLLIYGRPQTKVEDHPSRGEGAGEPRHASHHEEVRGGRRESESTAQTRGKDC